MKALLKKLGPSIHSSEIVVTGSKSESNRLLLLQALYPNIIVENLSESDDTKFLQRGLEISKGIVDIHHAGTAMRFLTAYYAGKEGVEVILKGSDRMHERPIHILVDALNELGANITYLGKEGYPPLQITGRKLGSKTLTIKADISSQYISSLLLIASSLPNGLVIELEGIVTSIPYIEMTLALLKKIGVESTFDQNTIKIESKTTVDKIVINVESDWSSASYFYSFIALSEVASITLSTYSEQSLQGDAKLVNFYNLLGVETVFNTSETSITLIKSNRQLPNYLSLDLVNTPDLAQTIAVTCFGLNVPCKLTGLHTLKIKETDRLSALKCELEKLGATVTITSNSLELEAKNQKKRLQPITDVVSIETYHDHRMAMAFAPLVLHFPIIINDPMVVTKSFPTFWEDLVKMGVKVDFQ